MFGEGISKTGELVDLGSDLNIIKKSGSWYSYNEPKLGQGRDSAKECLRDNPELAEEIEAKIMVELKKK
jgi:recombination protein RecA